MVSKVKKNLPEKSTNVCFVFLPYYNHCTFSEMPKNDHVLYAAPTPSCHLSNTYYIDPNTSSKINDFTEDQVLGLTESFTLTKFIQG